MKSQICFTFFIHCLSSIAYSQAILPDTFGVTEQVHGFTIHDPFRDLEDIELPQVQAWMQEENNRTVKLLTSLPVFQEVMQEIEQYNQSIKYRSTVPLYFNGNIFVVRTESNANHDQIMLYAHAQDSGKIIFTTGQINTDEKQYKIDQLSPSPDGNYLAFSLYDVYTGMSEIRLLELKTYRLLPDIIDQSVSFFPNWLPDSRSFFYTQADEEADPEKMYEHIRVKLHVLGKDQLDDKVYIDRRSISHTSYEAFEFPSLYPLPDKKHVVLMIARGVSPHPRAYVASLQDVLVSNGINGWKEIISYEDEVTQLSWDSQYFYFLAPHGDAPHATSIGGNTQHETAHVVSSQELASDNKEVLQRISILPSGEREIVFEPIDGLIQGYTLSNNGIYIHHIVNGLGYIDLLQDGKISNLQLPYAGTVELGSIAAYDESLHPQLFIGLSGWNKGFSIFHFINDSLHFQNTSMRPSGAYEQPDDLIVREVEVTSHDGEKIPLSIIYHKDLVKDGTHPAIIEVYGAYGESLTPYFAVELLSWYKRGGIMAYAHVRGGGEKGIAWHKAAVKENKPNSWYDLIACARYLISEGYTRADKLGLRGGSAGGIAAGRAITTEPGLFGAALLEYPLVNTSRLDQTVIGPAQADEFGRAENPQEFGFLLEMDTYHHVQAHTHYPTVMLTTGNTDHLVPVWQASKLAALLIKNRGHQDGAYFRLYQGGHFTGEASEESLMKTEALTFFIWQLMKRSQLH